MDEPCKHNAEWKTPDTKEYVPYESIYLKIKTK